MIGMEKKDTYDIIRKKYKKISLFLGERACRMWVATEAESIGYGGQRIVHRATGVAINTIRKGIKELKLVGDEPRLERRERKKGGGRKLQVEKDLSLKNDILSWV